MYSYEQVLEATIKYFNGNELSAKVWIDKYALRDNNNNLLELTPDDMHKRIAKEFARIEKNKFKKPLTEDEIYSYLKDFSQIIPQGSPMYGIGNPYKYVTLSNCYVLTSPLDSYNSILDTDKQLVNISKRRGGVGISLDNLRPTGAPTKNSARSSTGVPSFMERYSNSTREVGQCLAGDNYILTENGIQTIQELYNIGFNGKVWTKQGFLSAKVIQNPSKQIFKVTTKAGFSLRCSEDHVIFAGDRSERPLKNFKIGDTVSLLLGTNTNKEYQKLTTREYVRSNYNNSNRLQNVALPSLFNEELAYLIGYSYGDGYVEKGKNDLAGLSLACSDDWPEIKQKLSHIIKNQFLYEPKIGKGDGRLETINIFSRQVIAFLSYNKILKQKSECIVVPEIVEKSPDSVICAFLSGYFDADGYASGSKKGYVFSSIQKDFLLKCQVLLMSLGIVSKIHSEDRSSKGWNTLYSLCIIGKFSKSKTKNIFQSIKIQNCDSGKRDHWITPYTAKDFNIKRKDYKYCPDNKLMSLNTLSRLKDSNIKTNELMVIDSIVSIETDGFEITYDLMLEKEHLFWCNGFYVHNSARRGALMETLSVHHPDISNFINIKKDKTKVTGANISVKLTDRFLQAVETNTEYTQSFPLDDNPIIEKNILAKNIWNEIIESAHASAEPGLLFWDNIINESPADCYSEFGFRTISTNPCSELPLSELDSCRLMVINLFSCIDNPYTKKAKLDFEKLKSLSIILQRLMDDMIDLEIESIDRIINKIKQDPEPITVKQPELDMWYQIRNNCYNGRRTGSGITALGDVIAALNIPYGSNKSLELVDNIFCTIKLGAYQSSIEMAKELGPFPIWNKDLEKDNAFLLRIKAEAPHIYEEMQKYGRRNIALLTCAPTGSLSMLAKLITRFGSTSGIEPCYLDSYIRRKKINPNDENTRVDFVDQSGDSWMEFEVLHTGLEEFCSITGQTSKNSPYNNCCAGDLDWKQRVQLQSIAQKHIDHAISSTVNIPNNATIKDVDDIYRTAWKSGCKGITVYRDGCRTGVLVTKEEPKQEKRPKSLPCDIYHISVSKNPYLVFVGINNGPYEIMAIKNGFVSKNVKKGVITKIKRGIYQCELDNGQIIDNIVDNAPEEEALTRMISTALRHGADISFIVHQLEKTRGDMTSFAKCIARALKKYIPDGTKVHGEECSQCGSELVREEGCLTCKSCGFSKCS